MSKVITGGCACGATRYEFSTEPVYMGNCHCRDCQRATGSAHATVVAVSVTAFTVTTGTPKFRDTTSDSCSQMRRGFCVECGSPLFVLNSSLPDVVILYAGNIDDPSWVRPSLDIFTASAQPWDYMDPAIPKVSGMPSFSS